MVSASIVSAFIDNLVITLTFDLGVSFGDSGPNFNHFQINSNRLVKDIDQPEPNQLVLFHEIPISYGQAFTLDYRGDSLIQVFDGRPVRPFSIDLENLVEPPSFQEEVVDFPADVQAFIDVYGKKEAIEISNLDQPNSRVPNVIRIQRAIEDARRFIQSYIQAASWAGKAVIRGSQSRTELIIARYYLDTKRRRRDVLEDYERALEMIDSARSIESPTPDQTDENGNRINRLIINKKPRRYDRHTREGLRGWWTTNTIHDDNSSNYQ